VIEIIQSFPVPDQTLKTGGLPPSILAWVAGSHEESSNTQDIDDANMSLLRIRLTDESGVTVEQPGGKNLTKHPSLRMKGKLITPRFNRVFWAALCRNDTTMLIICI
jgi:hypothetical protein